MLGMSAAGELLQVGVALVAKLLLQAYLGRVVAIDGRDLDRAEESLLDCFEAISRSC